MKNKARMFFLKINICILLLSSFTGCWSTREINDLEIVIGLGVDKSDVPGNILLTAQVVKPDEVRKPSQEAGGVTAKAYWNVNSTEVSVFNAVRDITHKTGNKLFVSHSQLVVFGGKIAAEGIRGHLDFFLRTHEIRPTALVLISRGTAEEVLDVKPEREKLPAMYITKLIKSYGFTSHYMKVNLQDFSAKMMSRTTSPVAPLVEISQTGEGKDFTISGLAVFKNFKMAGALNKDESRGLLWVLGEVKSGVINVPSPDGQGMVVLEILNATSIVTPEIREGKLYINVDVKEEASIAEQLTGENLVTIPAFEALQKSQAEMIRKEIMGAFEKSRDMDADVFGFGEMFHKKYRNEWKRLEQDWDNLYKSIELKVNIDTRILRSDLLTGPVAPERG